MLERMRFFLTILMLICCVAVDASQVVLVTGASRGIGFAIAQRLSRKGYVVYAGKRATSTLQFLSPLQKLYPDHLFMVDLRAKKITGKDAATLLDRVQITVNKNLVPFDTESPVVTSGVRIGTPAITTRGMKEAQMILIADLIDRTIINRDNEVELEKIRQAVETLAQEFQIYSDL